jgi:hypothetical protein
MALPYRIFELQRSIPQNPVDKLLKGLLRGAELGSVQSERSSAPAQLGSEEGESEITISHAPPDPS